MVLVMSTKPSKDRGKILAGVDSQRWEGVLHCFREVPRLIGLHYVRSRNREGFPGLNEVTLMRGGKTL